MSLYEAARSESSVISATNQLMALFEQPASIFDHLFLIEKCDNIIVRKYASLILSRLFRTHLSSLNIDQAFLIQDSLLKLIANDSDLYVRYFLCDSVFTFLSIIENTQALWASFSQNNQWLHIFDFANQLVKKPDLLSTGLHLWRNIYALFPYSGSNELLFALLSITSTALSSESTDDRLQALKLLDHLRGNIPDQLGSESQAEVVQTVLQSLLDEMNISIYSKYDIDEIGLVIKVVAAFLDNPPPFLEFDHLSIFFELAFNVLTEKSFTTRIRLMVHRIIESSVDMIVDNYRDRLNILIQISVELSLEVCNQQRDDNNYEFPISFFYTIVDAYDSEIEGIFELFLSFANRLIFSSAQEGEIGPAERQVALLIITSIIEGTQEIVSERINDLIQFVLQISDYDDPYVFSSACSTLNELIEYVTSPLSLYVEDISSYVLQYINKYTNDAIMLLDKLFSKCGRVPKDTDHIYSELTSLINQPSIHSEQIEMIISCMSSLLLQSNSPEAYISSFLTTLNKIFQHRPDLRDVVFNFYGNASTIAPSIVKKDLPNLSKMILSTLESADHLQDEANFQFFQSAALCLKQIAQVLPVSLISISAAQQAVPFLLKMITLNETDQLKIQNFQNQDESLYMHAQSAAISCLLTFLGHMPNTMQKYIQDPLMDFLIQRHDILPSYITSLCDSIAESIQGFHVLGIQLYDLVIIIITKILMFTEKKDVIISILTMLTEVVNTYKSDILKRQDVLHTFISSIYQILTAPPLGFLKTEHSSYIDQQIQLPLFQFINGFIYALLDLDLNLSTSVITNTFIPSILPYVKSYSSLMKGNSILQISKIIFYLTTNNCIVKNNNPSDEAKVSSQQISELIDNLMQVIIEANFEVIAKSQNTETRRIVAISFMFLIPVNRALFADKLDILLPFSIELIEFCGFIGLWATLDICFSPQNLGNQERCNPLTIFDHSNWTNAQFILQSNLTEENAIACNFNIFENFAALVAVINEFPGGISSISFESEFAYFLKNQINSNANSNTVNEKNENEDSYNINQISSLLDEKLLLLAVTLFTANDYEFEPTTQHVKAAFAQIILDMKQETLIELANANEAKLVNLQKHLRMATTSSSIL